MKLPIYLDYSATTPVDPRVAEKMIDCLTIEGNFGNPASRSHVYGWRAEEAVENARQQVADLINADPREIVWTSGATESDNLAIKGVANFYGSKGKHLITSKIEHKAVLDTMRQLEREGFEVTYLDPDEEGIIHPQQVQDALREDSILVSIMHVNNEIGTVNDIAAIGEITRANKVLFHVDAAQSAGKTPIDVASMKVDLISFSGHKAYFGQGRSEGAVRKSANVLKCRHGECDNRAFWTAGLFFSIDNEYTVEEKDLFPGKLSKCLLNKVRRAWKMTPFFIQSLF